MAKNLYIKRRIYNYLKNSSIAGLGVTFIYYAFFIENYPDARMAFNVVGYISFAVFIISFLLKIFKRIK
ncbi:MAG: hypothetical protein EA412_00840 [Chitinophagaceae bacterium]|nr:MAG: hypothetical protein EA412_00840 [Chitinophagaceae bacterium]